MPDIDTMIQRLETRLAANPNDVKGQTMMARSYANLGRNDDALKAWHKVLELEPGNIEAQGGIALLLLQSGSEGEVREALTHIAQLRKAEPNEPAWLWYQAMGQNLLGQDKEARATLEKMLPMLPPESEKAAMVQEALEQLKPAK
jgi:cytochrome c-type biogenesis protein CcmH